MKEKILIKNTIDKYLRVFFIKLVNHVYESDYGFQKHFRSLNKEFKIIPKKMALLNFWRIE